MKITGTIKVLSFKGDRVAIKLGDAQFLTRDREWKDWNDWDAIEKKQVGKGEIWISSFKEDVYQACKGFDEDDDSQNIQKGAEIVADVKENKGFWNITSIGLKVPDKDIHGDMPPDDEPTEFKDEEGHYSYGAGENEEQHKLKPSSKQRPKDSPEAKAEEMVEKLTPEQEQQMMMAEAKSKELSTTLDRKDTHIIRECCIYAVGYALSVTDINKLDAPKIVALAKRLEEYVLTGK